MRVITLNANGIRSAAQKGFFEWMRRQAPDVVCLQETRPPRSPLPRRIGTPRGYSAFFHHSARPGYSGVALLSRREPDRVVEGTGWPDVDAEGRYIRADFGRLSVISWYMPSGSSSLARQRMKLEVMGRLLPHLSQMLGTGRELIVCGDFNIAHKPIDLRNWRCNQKNSGFLPEERAWMDQLLATSFVDAFRVVNQQPEQYTWWSNRGQSWAKNVGWRLDYQIVSSGLARQVRQTSIFTRRRFSDHAPLTIDYEIPF
jgi:exodeoxyribonuclease-3